MPSPPLAILSDMVSGASIAAIAQARGLDNPVLSISSRDALDKLFEPFDAEHPWPGRLIGFYTDVVVPRRHLNAMALEPVNLHPAPPEYPGRRAFEFAMRDKVNQYGVTAHIMTLPVDSGAIIAVSRFDVPPTSLEDAVRFQTWRTGFSLMVHLLPALAADAPIPTISATWSDADYSQVAWDATQT